MSVGVTWWSMVLVAFCAHSVFKIPIARTCGGQGKVDEADALLVRAIEIQEHTLGPDHPSLANSLGTRATVLKAQVGEVCC